MSYRDIWTNEHGEDGLRDKFSVYKTRDRDLVMTDVHDDDHIYDRDALLSRDGEFVFVLRPESDRQAWFAMDRYADFVEHRSPKLAADIRLQLRRIKLHQDQSHD